MPVAELAEVASAYAETILAAVQREYPNAPRHVMTGPDDAPTPRQAHPAFYGCFDWHSAVEMHWALVRLLRTVPSRLDERAVRTVLAGHWTDEAGRVEADYLRAHPGWERPYGWGWALMLLAELEDWAERDQDAGRWAAALQPLGRVISEGLLGWLPRLSYPERVGMHSNTAFALARALPWARRRAAAGDAELFDQIVLSAERFYARDAAYPAGWEPGGADFLSGALAEAELVAAVAPLESFRDWLGRFLPGIAHEQPQSLFTPVRVSDSSDGQIAHLHGLNLHRAYGFDRLARLLPPDDVRVPPLQAARDRHAAASLPVITGSDWMVEHWLAAYAVLLLT